MKNILAFSAAYDGEVVAGSVSFEGGIPVPPRDGVPFDSVHSAYGRGQAFLLFDSLGFGEGRMDIDFLKNLSARRKELWVCTPVACLGDLFDAFSTGIDYLVAPLSAVESEDSLMEMHEVSDAVVPALFAANGRMADGGSLESKAFEISRMGFEAVAVIDTDGGISEKAWDCLVSLPCGVIPYSQSAVPVGAGGIAFTDPFRPLP